MIKIEGYEIRIIADDAEMLAELTMLIRAIRDTLKDHYDEETVDKMIVKAGRLAYLSEEEMGLEPGSLFTKIKLEDEDVSI